MSLSTWTPEREMDLRLFYLKGLSCSQIAAELGSGITRNAVIGKIHRLGLDGRPKPERVQKERKQKAVLNSRRWRAKHNPTHLFAMINGSDPGYVEPSCDELIIPIEQRRTLIELTDTTCRFPIGDPATEGFYFCGGHPVGGKPYCSFHCRLAYTKPEPRKRTPNYSIQQTRGEAA